MTNTSDATPEPDDMPKIVPEASKRLGPTPSWSFAVSVISDAFRDGVLAERFRSLNAQIKTALADGELDGKQLAEDCRITPEVANTPCYVPPSSVSLAERSRQAKPNVQSTRLTPRERADVIVNGWRFNANADDFNDLEDRVARAITSAETAAREAAAQEMLRRFGETPMGNALAAAIRVDQPSSAHPEGWRSDMEAAKTLDEDVILGRTSDIFRIVAVWDEHPDHKGFSWVAPEGQRYQDAAFNRWMPLPPAPDSGESP